MFNRTSLFFCLWVGICLAPSFGQAQNLQVVAQQVHLASSASEQVPQDRLTLTLSVLREGTDAHSLQTQINTLLESALQVARRSTKPGQMDVHTGRFSLSPRYTRDGKLTGWQGSASLILEGRDFARITDMAGSLPTMTLASINFGLSPEQFQVAQTKVQAQAIAQFRSQATEIAKGFGFSDYTLVEVQVGAESPAPMLFGGRMRASSSLATDKPIAAEAGTSQVTVTVSGSIQLK